MSPLMKKSVRNRLVTGLVGLTLAVGLTGCSNDDEETLGDTIDASDTESLEYVPASADGPAQNVPEPNLPAVATENSEEGAEATVKYFWQAIDFGRLTGKTDQAALVSSEECALCSDLVSGWQEVYEGSSWAALDGDMEIETMEIVLSPGTNGGEHIAEMRYQMTEPAADFYQDGVLLEDQSFDTESTADWLAELAYDGTAQRWKIQRIGVEEHLEQGEGS